MCTCVLYEVYYSRKYISKGKVERRKICFKVLRVFYTRITPTVLLQIILESTRTTGRKYF